MFDYTRYIALLNREQECWNAAREAKRALRDVRREIEGMLDPLFPHLSAMDVDYIKSRDEDFSIEPVYPESYEIRAVIPKVTREDDLAQERRLAAMENA